MTKATARQPDPQDGPPAPYSPALDRIEARHARRPCSARGRIQDGRFRKGPVPRDTSPAAQRRRAVYRHHGNARRWTIAVHLPRRNRQLCRLLMAGWSLRRVARFIPGRGEGGRIPISHVHVRRLAAQAGIRWNPATMSWAVFDDAASRWVCPQQQAAWLALCRAGDGPYGSIFKVSDGVLPTSVLGQVPGRSPALRALRGKDIHPRTAGGLRLGRREIVDFNRRE